MDSLSHHASDGNSPEKRCSKCGNTFPATPEFFHRDKSAKDGLVYRCKGCLNKPSKDIPEGYKQCLVCEAIFLATMEFFPCDKNRKDGLFPHCKVCKKAYDKAHYSRPEVHKRKVSLSNVHYHHPDKHEGIRAYQKAYRSRPDAQERYHTWQRLPEVYERKKVHNRNRDARKKAIPGNHTPEQVREQYERQKGKCYYCQQKIKWGKHHVDHTFPLSRDGARNDIDSLVITCPPCNLKKHDKYPWEFYEGGKLL